MTESFGRAGDKPKCREAAVLAKGFMAAWQTTTYRQEGGGNDERGPPWPDCVKIQPGRLG